MKRLKLIALVPLLASAAPVLAANAPSTRLVNCGPESCLLVSGRRNDTASPVSINGHVVAAEGARKWRVRLPIKTVRAWSAPYARTISVSVAGTAYDARLPIGLLGHVDNLAMLEIRAK